ncbi:MAG: cytochrome c [Desulfarculus sp.]|nr:cytochrome c [Pseudomonadota bacterium]MBV1717920.1 cytochrome c [Desulfarculus sp.]MBU4576949.1 cytochrome c [Pseudomonadota bacterium]MBU4598092.1 cytochrome c [Pseudomonadota bacterium]MBV1739870.1 cytochrome c [Desulfarculus sp.]
MRSRSFLNLTASLLPALVLAAGVVYSPQASGQGQAASQPQAQASPELAAQGRKHFQRYCQACHDPQDNSRRTAPDLTGLYGRGLTPAMKQPVTDANLGGHIKQGGPRMPPFPWLSKQDIAALLAYLKTL